VLRRLEVGRLHPHSPFELSYAIVSTIARDQEAFVAALTSQVSALEQRVMRGDIGKPEQFLEELFRARHGLLAVRTMATLSHQIYGRMASLSRTVPEQARPLVNDLVDQFSRVSSVADGEREFLQGVIEFYQTRTHTTMTIAMERLAVIAATTLPVTALASIYGMNVIVNARTDFPHVTLVLVAMAAISTLLLRWAKRQGWW
jgi:Mg2+ and Co2+ transporter CorA